MKVEKAIHDTKWLAEWGRVVGGSGGGQEVRIHEARPPMLDYESRILGP